MKIKYKLALFSFAGIASLVICLLILPQNAESRIVTNVQPDISSEQLKAVVVEDFETTDASKWTVSAVPKKLDNPKKPEDNPVEMLDLKLVDGSPSDMVPEKWAANNKGLQSKKCLGIRFKFRYPGFNSVHIVPYPKKNPEDKEYGIKLPGRSKGISLWFHGRGHDYALETWVEDYKGDVHILKFGSINYVGWRPLKTVIPVTIPQKIESFPQTRWLKIVRFVIRAEHDAGNVEAFMFMDQVKVLTDDYEVFFDGRELHKAFGGKEDAK